MKAWRYAKNAFGKSGRSIELADRLINVARAVSTLTVLVGVGLVSLWKLSSLAAAVVCGSIAGVAIGTLFALLVIPRREQKQFEVRRAHFCWTITDKRVDDLGVVRRSYFDQSRFVIESLVDDLKIYPYRYRWSGDGSEGVPSIPEGRHQVLSLGNEEPVIDGSYRWFFIYLESRLVEGHRTTIQIDQEFHETTRATENAYRYNVPNRLEALDVEVVFLPGDEPKEYYAYSAKGASGDRRVLSNGATYSPHDRTLRLHLDDVAPGLRYGVTWHF